MNNNKPLVKLKTIQFITQKKYNKIFDNMTSTSKNIFNCCVFVNNFFSLYLNLAYKNLYVFLKSVKKSELDDWMKDKIIKNNNSNIILNYLKQYYVTYSNNHKLMVKNNDIIYDHIKNKIGKIVLNSSNIKQIHHDLIDELNNIIEYDESNRYFVFENIVEKIIKSFYDKNYFLIRYQLINKIPLKFKDGDLINDIKNNNYYFEKLKYVNYKNKIQNRFNVDLLSNQYIFKKFVYENCLGNNKDKLPADITLNIIDKYSEAINGYYGKIAKKMEANKPKYLDKNSKFNLFYFPSSFKLINESVRLTLGKHISENYNEITNKNLVKISDRKYCNSDNIVRQITKNQKKNYIKLENSWINKSYIIDNNFLYLNLPKILRNKKIKQIVIKPYGNTYLAYFTFEETQENPQITKKITPQNSISIDTGIKNLMTIYNPTGLQHIIKGTKMKSINEFYNKKIGELQSINKKIMNKDTFNRMYSLLNDRKNIINGEINRIINKLIEIYHDKTNFIIGYNEGWKIKTKMGTKNNRIFYNIPYARIIYKLKEKLSKLGKNLIVNEESYTSKCDSLGLEEIGYKNKYIGERVNRGLFISSTGKAINADLNGAINIMRKVIPLKKILGENIYNPSILVA
jgi:IS605 OrfB family transposase